MKAVVVQLRNARSFVTYVFPVQHQKLRAKSLFLITLCWDSRDQKR